MLRHFITTIDYAKLIEFQASQGKTRIEKTKSESLKACPQSKVRKHKLYNSVNRRQ